MGARYREEWISKRIFDTYQEIPLTSASPPTSTPSDPFSNTHFHTAREKAYKPSHQPSLTRDNGQLSRVALEPDFSPPSRQTDPADALRHTIPPSSNDLSIDNGDYCTWSDVKKKRAKNRRKRADTDSKSSVTKDKRDTLNDTLVTLHLKNFLHGTLAKRLRKPDPTLPQLNEYRLLKGTKEWRKTKYAFIKWINTNKELRFASTPSVAHFVEWNRTMRTHFKDCDTHNTICQFEVATTTFTKNAHSWWDAHCTKCPGLLVTYEQLLE